MANSIVDRFLAGDHRALPRLISLVEAGDPLAEDALARIYPLTGNAHVVGITGPPGAGKSSLVAALIGAFRERGRKIGVVAIDPSSPHGGGAVLGDRIRMGAWHADPDVFVRSLAARGQLGGLARAAASVVLLLDAAGYDPILVETVGSGQDGIAIADLAQTVVVLQVPGLGDGVQAIKAGLLEIGDLLVVNKADLPGAAEVVGHLQLARPTAAAGEWAIPLLLTSTSTGQGIEELRALIDEHRDYQRHHPRSRARLVQAARQETLDLFQTMLDQRLAAGDAPAALAAAFDLVAARRLPPATLAAALLVAVEQHMALPSGAGESDPVRDQGGGRPSPNPVVDIDHDEPRRARLQHRRHRPDPAAAEPVADGSG